MAMLPHLRHAGLVVRSPFRADQAATVASHPCAGRAVAYQPELEENLNRLVVVPGLVAGAGIMAPAPGENCVIDVG